MDAETQRIVALCEQQTAVGGDIGEGGRLLLALATKLARLERIEQVALDPKGAVEAGSLADNFRRAAVLLQVDEMIAELRRLKQIEAAARDIVDGAWPVEGGGHCWYCGSTKPPLGHREDCALRALWAAMDER